MNFKLKKIKVAWVSGMPRSGTTWLSQIFASSPDVRLKSCPLFSYEFKNSLDESSSREDWEKLFSELYNTNSEFLDQEHLRKKGLIPTFNNRNEKPQRLIIKSNRFHNLTPQIMELNNDVRFIHIVRHPCATIYSWLSNPHEFPDHLKYKDEWRMGKCRKTGPGEFWGYEDWKQVTTQALRLAELYPDRYRIIRYEDLVMNTEENVVSLFGFLQLPYGGQTREFISFSQSKHDDHKHSVFKSRKLNNEWEKKLCPEIILECLNEIKDTELEQFVKS